MKIKPEKWLPIVWLLVYGLLLAAVFIKLSAANLPP